MGVELFGFALAGCILGIATGLLPGLHVNTIALIALGMQKADSTGFTVLIASMAVVHSFVDFIPSVLLGAPSDETFLAVLPGHRLLLKGEGLTAVRLTIAGGLFAGIVSIAFGPFLVILAQKSQLFLSQAIPFVLAAVLAGMALDEKGKKKAFGVFAIIASGLLGMLALKSALPLQQPLFALATGFFGASSLLDSLARPGLRSVQEKAGFHVPRKSVFGQGFLAVGAAGFVSLMPSVGASQAAFIVRKIFGRIKTKDYLVLLGGINTATMILSFFMLFSLGKARTGAAAAIGEISQFGMKELLLVSATCLFATGFACIAANLLASGLMGAVHRLDYRKLNLCVLCLVTFLVFLFSGPLGIGFYAVAAMTGLFCISTGIKRSNCMAFLMVPTLLYYLSIA